MVYCDCQVIFVDDFFDQVVGAILGKIVRFSIKGQVVLTSPDITHTLTLIVEAASIIIRDSDRTPLIDTNEWLRCGTGSRFLRDTAIDASSSCAVVNSPRLSILSWWINIYAIKGGR